MFKSLCQTLLTSATTARYSCNFQWLEEVDNHVVMSLSTDNTLSFRWIKELLLSSIAVFEFPWLN